MDTNVLTIGDLMDAHAYAMRRVTKAMCTRKGYLGDVLAQEVCPGDSGTCFKYQTKRAFRSLRLSEGPAVFNDGTVLVPQGENAADRQKNCPVDHVYSSEGGKDQCLWSSDQMYEEFVYDSISDPSRFPGGFNGMADELASYHRLEEGKCVIAKQSVCEALSHSKYASLDPDPVRRSCIVESTPKNIQFNPYLEWRQSAGLCDVTPAKSCTSDDDCPGYNWCYGVQPAWGDDLEGLDWAKWAATQWAEGGTPIAAAGQCRASPSGQICPYGNACDPSGRCQCKQTSDCAGSAMCVNGLCDPTTDINGQLPGQCVIANDDLVDMMVAPQCKCPEQNPTSTDGSNATIDCREAQDFSSTYLKQYDKSPPMHYDKASGGYAITPEYCKYFGRKFTSGKMPPESMFMSGDDKPVWEACYNDSDCKVTKDGTAVRKPGYACHLFPVDADRSALGFSSSEWAKWTGLPENTTKTVKETDDFIKKSGEPPGNKYRGVCVGQDSTCFTPFGYTVAAQLTGNTLVYSLANFTRFKQCITKGLANKLSGEVFGPDNSPWTASPPSQKDPSQNPTPDPGSNPSVRNGIDKLIRQALNSSPHVDVLLMPPEDDAILAYPQGVGPSHVYVGHRPGSPTLVLQFNTHELQRLFPKHCAPENGGVRFVSSAQEASKNPAMKRLYYFVQNSEVLAKTFLRMLKEADPKVRPGSK